MVLLPFDCVRSFLVEHPALEKSATSAKSVHALMVSMISEEEKHTGATAEPPHRSTFECTHCKGTEFAIYERGGDIVCSHCGVCERWINPDNAEYFAERGHKTHIQDVDPDNRLRDELQHWSDSPGSRLKRSKDELDLALTRAELLTRAPVTERCIAALLLPDILAQIDLADVAHRVQNGLSLPSVVSRVATTRFACVRCGLGTHTLLEARHHCAKSKFRAGAYAESPVPLKRRLLS